MQQVRRLPQMPLIGQPESYYARQVQLSDKIGDLHLHEASKVGQYITLAVEPRLSWEKKLKYFDHAIRRHCCPPPLPDDETWMFYQQLGNLVRYHCGDQALRLASKMDDEYARRLSGGEPRASIVADARHFFYGLMTLGEHKPSHFNEEDWAQLKLIRDQWMTVSRGSDDEDPA